MAGPRPRTLERARNRMIPLRDTGSARSFPFWTAVIIVANIVVFMVELSTPNQAEFLREYALVPARLDPARPVTLLPLVTSQFLHAGFLHIISNMWFLWVFGDNVEHRMGFAAFPVFYVASGIAGALLQSTLTAGSDVPMLGASAAIAGALGAYIVMFPGNRVRVFILLGILPWTFTLPAAVMLAYWFGLQILSGAATLVTGSLEVGGVAWFAHIGGFLTGLVAGAIYRRR